MPYLFYDLLIIGFLTLDTILIYLYIEGRRRKFSSKKDWIIFSAAVVVWLIIFYGSFIEPRLLIVRPQTIILADSPTQTLRIALISDLHVGPYKKADWVSAVVEKTNQAQPDFVLLAGDFLFGESYHTEYLKPLENLQSRYGTFAVLGNHDYEEDFSTAPDFRFEGNARVTDVDEALRAYGVKVLKNEAFTVLSMKNGRDITIGGVDEVWTSRASLDETFKGAPAGAIKILVTHNPDIVMEAKEKNIPLVLAGHTHCGQIRLPFIGSVPEIPTELGRKYDCGLFKFKGTQLFITGGVGESGPRARLFNPPEISLLEIKL